HATAPASRALGVVTAGQRDTGCYSITKVKRLGKHEVTRFCAPRVWQEPLHNSECHRRSLSLALSLHRFHGTHDLPLGVADWLGGGAGATGPVSALSLSLSLSLCSLSASFTCLCPPSR